LGQGASLTSTIRPAVQKDHLIILFAPPNNPSTFDGLWQNSQTVVARSGIRLRQLRPFHSGRHQVRRELRPIAIAAALDASYLARTRALGL